jgi:uncharacterized protein (DUF302 family)
VRRCAILLANTALLAGTAAGAEIVTHATPHTFEAAVARVEAAVEAHGMVRIATASASRAAAQRGIAIPGNAVVLTFRNDYAVRLLAASVPAGIEAPLPIYVTEAPDGTARLSYKLPSSVLAPYAAPADLSRELDEVFAAIVADAARR